jgi:hypothetical protein
MPFEAPAIYCDHCEAELVFGASIGAGQQTWLLNVNEVGVLTILVHQTQTTLTTIDHSNQKMSLPDAQFFDSR